MSTNVFSMADVARLLGITRSQAFREVQSWPHEQDGLTISFTANQVAEVKRIMTAGPDEQRARRAGLEQRMAEMMALDAA